MILHTRLRTWYKNKLWSYLQKLGYLGYWVPEENFLKSDRFSKIICKKRKGEGTEKLYMLIFNKLAGLLSAQARTDSEGLESQSSIFISLNF